MRPLFVLCFVASSLVVASPVAHDEDVVVPLAVRLTDERDGIRPLRLTVRATPVPTPAPTAAPATAAPRTATPRPPVLPVLTPTPTPDPTPDPTPPPTPRPTPTPTPSPSNARTYSREEVKDGIRAAWGGDDDEAIRVADCESGLNPRATSSSGHLGLWQMRPETWRSYGGSGDPRDHGPAEQTAVAYRLYQQRGWSPWAGCAG